MQSILARLRDADQPLDILGLHTASTAFLLSRAVEALQRSLCCIVGALIFFGYFLPRWGFVISFPLMIIITSLGSHVFHWLDALLSATVLTALSYLIFIYGLDLTIPLWPA